MAWLDDNPPATQQFRCPRRESQSGVIGIHTAESFPDESPPDDGAENVAGFISRRSNYGSYHDICDSDSIVHLVRDGCVAYHIGTFGINEHSYGISAATQAHKWNQVSDEWADATVRNMARAAADYERRSGLTIPARWLSQDQAANRVPGFVRHSVADPDRRTDPGATFPANTFMAYYIEEREEKEMANLRITAPNGEVWDADHAFSWIMARLSELSPWGDYVKMPNGKHWSLPHVASWLVRRTKEMRGVPEKLNAIAEAIKNVEGVDAEALAAELNRIDAEAVAEAVADEQAERMQE